jgi:hypothetical protein
MALAQDVRDKLTLPAFAAPMFLCSGVELATAWPTARLALPIPMGIGGSSASGACRSGCPGGWASPLPSR